MIQNLKQDNQRMLRILSELLNMSQVEAGKIQLDIVDVKPETIVDTAIITVSNTAREKSITIQKDYGENPGMVKADAEKTGWVLNNFLTNAIKHAPEGSTITVSVKRSGNEIEVAVSDQGPGIPSEFSQKYLNGF
ncbi:MAG: HAMP domain-containing sensor histidine kinase [Bacteroidota bacterium]